MEKKNVSTAKWNSRRSPVYSTKGMVACTQPLAAAIGTYSFLCCHVIFLHSIDELVIFVSLGVKILNEGGTAADAGMYCKDLPIVLLILNQSK